MKTRLENIWVSFSNLGVSASLSSRDIRITRLINRFSFCIIAIMLFSFTYQIFKSLIISGEILQHSFLMLATFSPFALVFLFNKYRKYNVARLVIVIYALLNNLLWTFTNVGQESNIYIANIILVIPIMIFFRKLKTQIALIVLTYVFFILSYYVDMNHPGFIIKENINENFSIVVFGTWILLSFLMLRFFINEIDTAETKLELKNTELEDFTRLASHDMKEPLRTISSFSSLMRKRHGDEIPSKASDYLEYIESGSKRLNDLLDDLSNYSMINFNDLELKEVDLNEVLRNVKMDLKLRILDTNTVIENDPLPKISGNESHMTQLFLNLISNGIKFQPKEGKKNPIISIKSESDNGFHTITFKDNGIGISKDNLSKVFTKFKKLHNRKEYEGTGLGLATCQRIAELYQGKITIESEPGIGTSFKVMIADN